MPTFQKLRELMRIDTPLLDVLLALCEPNKDLQGSEVGKFHTSRSLLGKMVQKIFVVLHEEGICRNLCCLA